MAGKSNTRKKAKSPAKAEAVQAKPFNPDAKNKLGQSAALEQAINTTTDLVTYHYHRVLAKYIVEGEAIDAISVTGVAADGTPTEAVSQDVVGPLIQDLAVIEQLLIRVNNMQRIRSDEALDIVANPM